MPVMNCARTRELLAPLIDGELSVDLSRRALTHVDDCAACQAEMAALRAVGNLVRDAAAPAPTGLRARILTEARQRAPVAPKTPLTTICTRAAAMLLGAAAVVLSVPDWPQSTGSPASKGSPYGLLVTESQGEVDLAGSLRGNFLALARSPESRLLHQLIGGR